MLIGNQPAQCNKGMQNSSPATLWTLPPTSRYADVQQCAGKERGKAPPPSYPSKTRTRTPRPAVDATIKLGKHILLHGVFSGVFVDRYGPFSSFSGRAAPAPRPRALAGFFRFLSFFVVLSSCQTFMPAATSLKPAAPGDRAAGPRSRGPRRASRSPRAAASSPSRRASPRRGRVSAAARP